MTHHVNHLLGPRPYPAGPKDRQARRDECRRDLLAQAEAIARAAGTSWKCEQGQHDDGDYGCRNDGSGCLCECHDMTVRRDTPALR